MEKDCKLNEENLDRVSGGAAGYIFYRPDHETEGQGIVYDPSKVVENVLKCDKCGYVLNQDGPACLTAYCPACGAPLFGM